MHFERAGRAAPAADPGRAGHRRRRFSRADRLVRGAGSSHRARPRGYGRSRPPERDYPLDFYRRDAADMFALMSALGHDRFSIIGWSDGANIAVIMAAEQPERVARLVVFGGQSFLTPEEIAAFNNIRKISAWSPRAAEAMRAVYGDGAGRVVGPLCHRPGGAVQCGRRSLSALLAKVGCPTLVLHGAKDPADAGLHAEAIHRGIAGSRLHIFPEGKHNIHIRYANEFNALVHAFLTEPDRS